MTASTNTTVTLWDIYTSTAVTQLIAHDKEVYDVAWSPGLSGRDVFASCGADGSVRMFDIRSLEHSTILYEAPSAPLSPSIGPSATLAQPGSPNTTAPSPSPLLRIAYDPSNPSALAIVHDNSSSILILDVRQPGVPVAELKSHQANVNGIAWSGGTDSEANSDKSGTLVSVADDGLALVWDGAGAFATGSASAEAKPSKGSGGSGSGAVRVTRQPMFAYEAGQEINSVAWGSGGGVGGDFVACSVGRSVRCLRI